MAIDHRILDKHGIVLSSWVGDISDEDLLPSYRKLYENEEWKPGFHEIVDLRDAHIHGAMVDGLRLLSSMVESYTAGKCQGFKTAVIAPDDLPFGLSRMYEAISTQSPEQVKVFRTLAEACAWIGVDGTVFD